MPSKIEVGSMNDGNITQTSTLINTQTNDPRVKFLMERLIFHIHQFVKETRLTTEEWEVAISFLTAVGQKCTDIRQEFVLLSDVLAVSVLVDSLSHPKPENATIGTLLGPFHTHDAEIHKNGTSITSEGKGEPLLIEGKLTDTLGNPISGASISMWECDENGLYDTQYEERDGPDMRGIVMTQEDGCFVVKCIKPVPYAIPHDGPVGKLLDILNRHPYRPAHIHFIIEKPGYDKLITALYIKGDEYEKSDAVFGVKTPLLMELENISEEKAETYGMKKSDWYLNWHFKIITEEESKTLRYQKSKDGLKELGFGHVKLNEDGLPIADLD